VADENSIPGDNFMQKDRLVRESKENSFLCVKSSSLIKFSGRILAPLYNKATEKTLLYVSYNDASPAGNTSFEVEWQNCIK